MSFWSSKRFVGRLCSQVFASRKRPTNKVIFIHLSDSETQDASTTHWNMSCLAGHLKEKNALKKNGLILCNFDGCAGESVAFVNSKHQH